MENETNVNNQYILKIEDRHNYSKQQLDNYVNELSDLLQPRQHLEVIVDTDTIIVYMYDETISNGYRNAIVFYPGTGHKKDLNHLEFIMRKYHNVFPNKSIMIFNFPKKLSQLRPDLFEKREFLEPVRHDSNW